MAAGDRGSVLVTGGCRRIGAAIVARLRADGWNVLVHGRRDAPGVLGCDLREPGAAERLFARAKGGAGARVVFVSVCNGDNGHQTMDPQALAARRYAETQAAAKVYGIEKYVVMGEHDCLVEPSVDLRKRVTRLIREFAPHMVVTHRTCDYHADHRATGQVVQDATYLMGVPLFCPETPVPETLPFVMYAGDRFTLPRPFRPDLLVEGDDVLENTLRALACHESQLFEWLPPEYGIDPKTIPTGAEERIAFLKQHVPDDLYLNANLNRDVVNRAFPGRGLKYVDAFELCEYARLPCRKEIDYLVSLGFKWLRK